MSKRKLEKMVAVIPLKTTHPLAGNLKDLLNLSNTLTDNIIGVNLNSILLNYDFIEEPWMEEVYSIYNGV